MAHVTHAMLAAASKDHVLTKAEAGYVDNAPTFCAICEYFKGINYCELLQTTVNAANGCCDLWKKAPKKR